MVLLLRNFISGVVVVLNEMITTGLVSFGVRGDSFVVGAITADEVLDEQNPFQVGLGGGPHSMQPVVHPPQMCPLLRSQSSADLKLFALFLFFVFAV